MKQAMQPEELFETARARARALEVPRPPEPSALERLRTECAGWFDQLPEPPVYRRLDDPARRGAEVLIPEGQELLARCLSLAPFEQSRSLVEPLRAAVQAHLEVLCHTACGRLEKAEAAWHRALGLERTVGRHNRLWVRSDEEERPVYDRTTGASRFDPGPEPTLTVKLYCPHRACGAQERFRFSPRYSTHRFTCPTCRRIFVGYFGEVRGVERTRRGTALRYLFKLEELDGGLATVEVEDRAGGELPVARRDLLAFLYDSERQLEGVLNLSSSRVLLLNRSGGCFLATAAYGDGAPELEAFRDFRDRVLLPRALGRAAVRGYYAVGPGAAKVVRAFPVLQRAVRTALGPVHGWLVRGGWR
jgi:hypothetical protein